MALTGLEAPQLATAQALSPSPYCGLCPSLGDGAARVLFGEKGLACTSWTTIQPGPGRNQGPGGAGGGEWDRIGAQRPRWGASGLQRDRGVWILFACLKSALRCEVDPSRKPWIHRPQEWPTSLPEEGVAGLWQICAPRLDESLSLRLQVNPREALFPPPLSPRERLDFTPGAA